MRKKINLEVLLYEELHENIDIAFAMLGGVAPSPTEIKLPFNLEDWTFVLGAAFMKIQLTMYFSGKPLGLGNVPFLVQKQWLQNKTLPEVYLKPEELISITSEIKDVLLRNSLGLLTNEFRSAFTLDSEGLFVEENLDD